MSHIPFVLYNEHIWTITCYKPELFTLETKGKKKQTRTEGKIFFLLDQGGDYEEFILPGHNAVQSQ
jgi:hypothetical protein